MQIDGLVLGKYRVEKLINNGSFASVFRATEELTNRTVAIKTLPKSIYPTGRMRYLLTELSAMGMNWGHPNIVSIHTVEPGDGEYVAYIVMEYIDGPSLRQLTTVKPPAPHLAINIALDIACGLVAAHEHKIIHRDIKPQNILLTSKQRAKISDFGVARILEATSDYAGTITGTRKYMAPEQYQGNYDYRADLYSTGLILYEMLMGKFPFRGKSHDEIQMKKQFPEIEFSDKLPDDLCRLLRKALHRDVKARYQTAVEMYNDLDQLRKNWYSDAAGKTIESVSDVSIRRATLSKHREDLRLSIDAAEKIELEILYKQSEVAKKQKQLELESRVDAHYDQAIQYLRSPQAELALQEIQQAHRLYLSDVEATKKADRVFRSLFDLVAAPQSPSTAADFMASINQLSANEILEFKTQFYDQFPPSEPAEAASASSSYVHDTDDGSSSSSSGNQASNTAGPSPELVLRQLHEVVQNPHEIIAAQIRQSAEESAQQRKDRRARGEYKKLGEFYKKSATNFIQSEDWELVASCYARSQLAYIAARRHGSARQSAREAGMYYARLADAFERQKDWVEAGRLYTLSGEHYAHAELPENADESWLRATICYFNIAEDTRAAGNLNMAYDYCDKVLVIGKEMHKASNAVTGARKLIQEIETLFTANQ